MQRLTIGELTDIQHDAARQAQEVS